MLYLVCFILVMAVLAGGHSWLAVTAPVPARVLVVEAWFHDRPALSEAVDEFSKGEYEVILSVGSPASADRGKVSDADRAGEELLALGIEEKDLVVLRDPPVDRHRTYTSAVTVRDWLRETHPEIDAVNVFTLGVHARKSRLLFKKALGDVDVGVIAGTETAYTPWCWFCSPTGIRLVFRNFIGYLYALMWSLE